MGLLRRRPLVSVILASYNHEAFVERAVRSVLEQDVSPIELIVVDDGSPDKTADVVAGIRDPRIHLVRLAENRRYHPRNHALELARGRYVAFQNSDDEWAPGKLRAQVAQLEAHPHAVASFTGVAAIDEQGRPLTGSYIEGVFDLRSRTRLEWLRQFFDRGNCLCITSALARRDAVERAGRFRGSLMLWSDLDLWVRLAAQGQLLTIDQPLTRMRVLPGKNLSTPSPAVQRAALIENAYILERFTASPLRTQLPQIFSDQLEDATTEGAVLAGLVQHAWTIDRASHQLFADRIAAEVLDSPALREGAVARYGVEFIHQCIKHRRQLDLRTTSATA